MPASLVTEPAEEPISLEEAKLHLRIDHDDEDVLINGFITAARRHVELVVLNRALVTQTWNLYLNAFPSGNEIKLPYPPLQSVEGVYYTPEDGQEQQFAAGNYLVDTVSEPGRIVLKRDALWPADELEVVNGVRVQFVAGYGAADDVPRDIRNATLMLIGDLYENREETIVVQGLQIQRIPFGVANLLRSYRIPPELSHR